MKAQVKKLKYHCPAVVHAIQRILQMMTWPKEPRIISVVPAHPLLKEMARHHLGEVVHILHGSVGILIEALFIAVMRPYVDIWFSIIDYELPHIFCGIIFA